MAGNTALVCLYNGVEKWLQLLPSHPKSGEPHDFNRGMLSHKTQIFKEHYCWSISLTACLNTVRSVISLNISVFCDYFILSNQTAPVWLAAMVASKIHSSSWPENCIMAKTSLLVPPACTSPMINTVANQLPAYTSPIYIWPNNCQLMQVPSTFGQSTVSLHKSTSGQSTASLHKSCLHTSNELPAYTSPVYMYFICMYLT